ncbi:MAG: class D sortase [Acidimicrobiales bacterium]|jgi:LPXTG-site transpeptidase (sortase) family protein
MRSLGAVRRVSVTLVGAVLLFAAILAASYAIAHQVHQRHAQAVLVQSERSAMARTATNSHGAACQLAGVQPGQLSGILSIPAISLTAPVEEGTDDQELNVAVGHDPASVWPGVGGAAVFLAHDVSYFVHLNALKPGDVLTYQTACNTVKFVVSGQQVVPAGSPVSNTSTPSVVLDTCWPPNALFFTPDRLLVRATEVGAVTEGGNLNPGAEFIETVTATDYSTSAPPALQAQGLTLDQNEAPMGTMHLVNASVTFAQSPGPLALEAAALETYFGGLHAAGRRQASWWGTLAPGVAMPPQLSGATVAGHDAPLDVEIDSARGSPTQVVLRTRVTLAGGAAPGEHAMTVVLPVHGSVVTVGSWTFS